MCACVVFGSASRGLPPSTVTLPLTIIPEISADCNRCQRKGGKAKIVKKCQDKCWLFIVKSVKNKFTFGESKVQTLDKFFTFMCCFWLERPCKLGSLQAVSNRRFVNGRLSPLNDERCWHICERSPSRRDRSFCQVSHKIQCQR